MWVKTKKDSRNQKTVLKSCAKHTAKQAAEDYEDYGLNRKRPDDTSVANKSAFVWLLCIFYT